MSQCELQNERVKQQSLSIHLVKSEFKDKAVSALIKTEQTKPVIELFLGESRAQLFIRKQKETKPDWISWIAASGEVAETAFGRGLSTGAAMVVSIYNATFVLTFGRGNTLLNDEVIERDFGLYVALNTMEPEQVTSLDKLMGEANPLHARTQSIKGADVHDLLIDTEVDMLNAISGRVQEQFMTAIGNKVTGSDGVKIDPQIKIDGLPRLLQRLLSFYKAKLPDNYKWVNNIRR
ncbi:MAG: TIGR04141 family sporadically distributed protein [Algicola sp.]|nr:TIGR04141 family sporadically distributed protein [Algicola sp.]